MAHRQGGSQKRRRRQDLEDDLLLALDGSLAGKSHRLIAIDLYGKRKVAKEWCSDSPMRARVRWRIRTSNDLMKGGYRKFVAAA